VLKPGREAQARRIFEKWELDFAVIGVTTNTGRFVVKHKGKVEADIPVKALSDEAPVYERPYQERAPKNGVVSYDKKRNVHPTITKIGTGFSDEDLARFPKMLKPYESEVKPPNVESVMVPDIWYRPKVVIETIASEITLSPIHPAGLDSVRKGSGLALRFPKFTGKVRDEKGPEDATTVKEIVEMYTQQLKKIQAKPAE
ncbi:MAG: hypothetical protein OK454_11490, partial [Thaumarchaeota archaeon]|nr:hypothetical protein [Nitrososphaerota archaeon]